MNRLGPSLMILGGVLLVAPAILGLFTGPEMATGEVWFRDIHLFYVPGIVLMIVGYALDVKSNQ